mmetsp:Transcript_18594/g.37626  ORF Transcript_18594/g.37626 Transcript_18594/m.37626 type:complete len:80 (+) Transcript_18594:107-346(+)
MLGSTNETNLSAATSCGSACHQPAALGRSCSCWLRCSRCVPKASGDELRSFVLLSKLRLQVFDKLLDSSFMAFDLRFHV